MKPQKAIPLSEAASAMGKKGGAKPLALQGLNIFKSGQGTEVFGGGWPKGRPRKAKKARKVGSEMAVYKQPKSSASHTF